MKCKNFFLSLFFVSLGACSIREFDFSMKNTKDNVHISEFSTMHAINADRNDTKETFVEECEREIVSEEYEDKYPKDCENIIKEEILEQVFPMGSEIMELGRGIESNENGRVGRLWNWIKNRFSKVKNSLYEEKSFDADKNNKEFGSSWRENKNSIYRIEGENIDEIKSCPELRDDIDDFLETDTKSLPLVLPNFNYLLMDRGGIATNKDQYVFTESYDCDNACILICNTKKRSYIKGVCIAAITAIPLALLFIAVEFDILFGIDRSKFREEEKFLLQPLRNVLIENKAHVARPSLRMGEIDWISLSPECRNEGEEFLTRGDLFSFTSIALIRETNLSCRSISTITAYSEVINLNTFVLNNQLLPEACEIDLSKSYSINSFAIYNSEINSDIILPSNLKSLNITNTFKCNDEVQIVCDNCTEAVIKTIDTFGLGASINCTRLL